MQLAAAGWKVTALDISERRLGKVRQNLDRTGLQAEIIKANALTWEPAKQFDAILLDAPCTATGTCRRHPAVIHRIGSRQIEEQAELKARQGVRYPMLEELVVTDPETTKVRVKAARAAHSHSEARIRCSHPAFAVASQDIFQDLKNNA